MSSDIKVYAACLASYNNGILHGAWIDATEGVLEMRRAIHKMLQSSPEPGAEEWAFHDYDGFFDIHISEYASLESIADIADLIEEHGGLGAALFSHYGSIEDAKRAMDDQYAGQYRSVEEFAEELTEQTTEIPESLRYYIDYERMGRDLEINDLVVIHTGYDEVHIFWAH